ALPARAAVKKTARHLTAQRTERLYSQKRSRSRRRCPAMAPPFDPTHSVQFDLDRGRISMPGSDSRLLVPAEALGRLCAGASEDSVKDFGRGFGTEIGRRVAARLGDAVSVQAMVEHLGGELALAGFGSLGIEVWGRALVL